jgi:hypothetical protein
MLLGPVGVGLDIITTSVVSAVGGVVTTFMVLALEIGSTAGSRLLIEMEEGMVGLL